MHVECTASVVAVAIGDDGMGGNRHRAGKPRVETAEHGSTGGIVPTGSNLRVGVAEGIGKAVPEHAPWRTAAAVGRAPIRHVTRHTDIARKFADGGLVRRVVAGRWAEFHVRPVVRAACTSEGGRPRRLAGGGIILVIPVHIPALRSTAVHDISVKAACGGHIDSGVRPLPVAHDLSAHRGNTTADVAVTVVRLAVAGRVPVFAVPVLAPLRLHEIFHSHVGWRGGLEAQPALAVRRRAQACPLGGLTILLLYACCPCARKPKATSRTGSLPVLFPILNGRADRSTIHCRRHIDLEHRHERVFGGVGVPHALLRVGEDRLHRRIAGGHDETAALKIHDVVFPLAVLRRVRQDVRRRLRGECRAQRLLHVHPSGDGVHRLFARHLLCAQREACACRDSNREDCRRVEETTKYFLHVVSLLWLGSKHSTIPPPC